MLEFDIGAMAAEHGVADAASAYAVRVRPQDGNTPMRVAHQAVYRDADNDRALEASINLGLANANVFTPEGKTGFAWGQVPVGHDIQSWLGFCWNHALDDGNTLDIRFYDTSGLIAEQSHALTSHSALIFGPDEIAGIAASTDITDTYEPVWYEARSSRPDLSGFAVARHRISGACSGEHNF
jgi:hypothetical protein